MEREKRQTKPPEGYIIPPVCFPRIRKKKPKAKKVHEASYQVIPVPMKFTSLASFYALYAVSSIFLFLSICFCYLSEY